MRMRSSIARWRVALALGAVLACLWPKPVVSARAGEQDVRAPGLACIQAALGGVRAFARVTSLRIVAEKKPAMSSGPRPLPGTREIRVVFPDRYERIDVGRPPRVVGATLKVTVGFDRRVLLSAPRSPDPALAARAARWDFARQMWSRFPRQLSGDHVSPRLTREQNHRRVALALSGADGFQATLLADAASCVPVALEYPTSTQPRSTTTRVDLAGYREFGGIRFPTLLTTSVNGQALDVEHVSLVEVNAPGSRGYFASGR
jgi:hypothetical protein